MLGQNQKLRQFDEALRLWRIRFPDPRCAIDLFGRTPRDSSIRY
jgi:hypothetical protein